MKSTIQPSNPTIQLVLGYVRVSTNRQELSVEAQGDTIRRAAGFHAPGAELSIFEEPDTSGSIEFAKREQGAELLQTVKEAIATGRTVTVIVPKLDRLGRDTDDVRRTVKLIEAMGDPGDRTRIVFLDLNVDSRTPIGRLIITVVAACAEMELARIKERIQTVLDHKRGAGELTGSLSYGWNARYFFGDGHEILRTTSPFTRAERDELTAKHGGLLRVVLEDNPAEQDWILKMHHWYQAGWSYNRIAKELNHHQVPTKRAGETLTLRHSTLDTRHSTAKPVRGSWQFGQVQTILTNATVSAWLDSQQLKQAA